MNSCCGGGGDEDGVLNGSVISRKKLFNCTIPEIFYRKLNKNEFSRHKIAVQYGDYQTLTFEQVEVFSSAIAKQLSERVSFSTICKSPNWDLLIAICVSPSEKWVTLLFAILKTGAGYIPLDPDYPEQVLLKIIEEFQPILLVVDDNGPIGNKFDPDKFNKICKMVSVEELWLDMELPAKMTMKANRKYTYPSEEMELNVTFADADTNENYKDRKASKSGDNNNMEKPAVVIQTIGFLEGPIGVRISHRNLINIISWDWQCLGLKSKDVCTMTFPISSIENTLQVFTSILKGCTLNIFKRTDLNNMLYFTEMLAARHVTRIALYNYQLHYFLTAIDALGRKETLRRLGKLKSLICRGEVLMRPDVLWFFKVFCDGVILVNCVGSAEVTGAMVFEKFRSLKEFDSKCILGRLSLSKVFDNSRIYTLGTQNEIVNDGNQGEICCSGYNVALGYVNDSAIDAKDRKFQINRQRIKGDQFKWIFHTGEYGRICSSDEDPRTRHLYIEGRSDRIVKHMGHLVSVDNVKNFLSTLPCVRECFVLIYHQGKFDQELIAFFAMRPPYKSETLPDTVSLYELAREKLPDFAIPDDFRIIDEIPKTPSGKPFPTQLLLQYEQTREPDFSIMHMDTKPHSEDKDTLDAQKFLFSALFKFAYIPLEMSMANIDYSIFEIGVTSLNALTILLHLQHHGYPITLMEFLLCKTVRAVISLMVVKQRDRGADQEINLAYYIIDMKDTFVIDILSRKHKRSAVEMLSRSYTQKGYLQQYNLVTYKQFQKFFSDNWKIYEESNTSFVVKRKSDHKIIAVALNADFFQIIDTSKAEGALFHIIEFMHEIKGSCIDDIPKRKNECLENHWMATDKSLSAVDNIMLVTQMGTEIIKLGKAGYSCVFSSCFSPITKRLCQDIFGYRTLEVMIINQYIELDKSKPFKLAPDTLTAAACYLHIRTPEPISSLSSMTTDLSPEELMKFM